jgi:branched-chain amino acid transport system substrate-binding protein
MAEKIGVLLPRATDYPSIGFDLLDGMRLGLKQSGTEAAFITENIGFGDNHALNYAKTEKLIMEDNVSMIVAYASAAIAEPLFGLMESAGRPIIVLDANMTHTSAPASPMAYHISLQGMEACRLSGKRAAMGGKKVLMAGSFYEGGYRGIYAMVQGIAESGGEVMGYYVSGYKISEFNIDSYREQISKQIADSVCACFSVYLTGLFTEALKKAGPEFVSLPFYCSPFMAEETILREADFPGGTFEVIVPWATVLPGKMQKSFLDEVRKLKQKEANLFHLLGWEAGVTIPRVLSQGVASLSNWSFESPRGIVTFHPGTHYTFSPLHEFRIIEGKNGKCKLEFAGTLPPDEALHERSYHDKPEGATASWKNNYLCI